MADPALIPLGSAVACLWPHSADDPRLHLRIVRDAPSAEQRAWLAARAGRVEVLDAVGQGDARTFWQTYGRTVGWADDVELRREFARLDCDLGHYMRGIRRQLGEAAHDRD